MNEFPYTDEQLRQMFEVVFTTPSPMEVVDNGYKRKIIRESALDRDGLRCCVSVSAMSGIALSAYVEKLGDGPSADFEIEEVSQFYILAMAKLIESFGKKGGQNG